MSLCLKFQDKKNKKTRTDFDIKGSRLKLSVHLNMFSSFFRNIYGLFLRNELLVIPGKIRVTSLASYFKSLHTRFKEIFLCSSTEGQQSCTYKKCCMLCFLSHFQSVFHTERVVIRYVFIVNVKCV